MDSQLTWTQQDDDRLRRLRSRGLMDITENEFAELTALRKKFDAVRALEEEAQRERGAKMARDPMAGVPPKLALNMKATLNGIVHGKTVTERRCFEKRAHELLSAIYAARPPADPIPRDIRKRVFGAIEAATRNYLGAVNKGIIGAPVVQPSVTREEIVEALRHHALDMPERWAALIFEHAWAARLGPVRREKVAAYGGAR